MSATKISVQSATRSHFCHYDSNIYDTTIDIKKASQILSSLFEFFCAIEVVSGTFKLQSQFSSSFRIIFPFIFSIQGNLCFSSRTLTISRVTSTLLYKNYRYYSESSRQGVSNEFIILIFSNCISNYDGLNQKYLSVTTPC